MSLKPVDVGELLFAHRARHCGSSKELCLVPQRGVAVGVAVDGGGEGGEGGGGGGLLRVVGELVSILVCMKDITGDELVVDGAAHRRHLVHSQQDSRPVVSR